MAILETMPEEAIIRGFRGTLDFYYWCKLVIARQWPRSPGRRRASSVEAQWPAFAYAAKTWTTLTPEIQRTYQALTGNSGISGRDMFTRAYLSGLYRYPTGP